MGTDGLMRAIARGAPLVEITVCFKDGIDYSKATLSMNLLSDELDLYPEARYGNENIRTGSATKEALENLFGWRLKRVPLERWDEETKSWIGHWPNFFRWEEVVPVQFFPPSVANQVVSICMSQPGADDDGQWYE